jgi:methyl-accepting chemotaxis protein
MTQYNTAKSSALGSLDPNDIASFESAAQSFLPIARDFLGTSERFAAITGDVQDTVSQLISGISTRENTAPDLTPVVQATNDGAAAVVDAVNNASAAAQAQASDLQQQIADLTATVADQATQIQQLNASTTAVVMRYAGARVGSP